MDQAILRTVDQSAQLAGPLAGADPNRPQGQPADPTQQAGSGYGFDRMQTLQFVNAMAPQVSYLEASRQAARTMRSRTAVLSSIGLEQHHRVHDADEFGFVQDAGEGTEYIVRERQGGRGGDGRRQRRDGEDDARDGDDDGEQRAPADIFDTIVRVMYAAQTVATHRAHVQNTASAPGGGRVSPEIAFALRTLVREAVVPSFRRLVPL